MRHGDPTTLARQARELIDTLRAITTAQPQASVFDVAAGRLARAAEAAMEGEQSPYHPYQAHGTEARPRWLSLIQRQTCCWRVRSTA
jgi:hypothetical protein